MVWSNNYLIAAYSERSLKKRCSGTILLRASGAPHKRRAVLVAKKEPQTPNWNLTISEVRFEMSDLLPHLKINPQSAF
jgi:hypothetical protein